MYKMKTSSLIYPIYLNDVSHCLRVRLSLTTKKTSLTSLSFLPNCQQNCQNSPLQVLTDTTGKKRHFWTDIFWSPNLTSDWNQIKDTWTETNAFLRVAVFSASNSSDSWCEQHKLKMSSPWCAQRQACQSTVVDVVGGWQPFPRGFQGEQTRGVQGAETGWWVRWVFNFICFGGFRGCSFPRWWQKTVFLGTWNLKQSEARKKNCRQKFIFLLFWSRCLLAVIVWSIVLYILLLTLL